MFQGGKGNLCVSTSSLCVIVLVCKDGKDGCWCERPLSNDQ